jgi:hypothetical protein
VDFRVRSLGYRTDFIFNRFDGSVVDRGEYLVVRTDSNPNYFWGNLLLFKQPPSIGDLDRWRTIFRNEFTDPRVYHQTFAWDSPEGIEGATSEFLQVGFRLEKGVCLTASTVYLPKKHHPELVVRPISTEQDWEDAIQIQIACANESLSKSAWEGFYRTQMDRYRRMARESLGLWFGGWLGGKLIAGLGLFKDGTMGRYQLVSVHPSVQRRGVCGSLVYQAAQYGFQQMGLKIQVMVADEDYHAARIYESVGFSPTEKMLGLCWWDKTRTS